MIKCKSILPYTPDVYYEFTEDMKTLFLETERFVKIQMTQILSYIHLNSSLDELILKYDIQGNLYEKRFPKREKRNVTEKNIMEVLQKELLFYLLKEYNKA